jgi:hypothetical protein
VIYRKLFSVYMRNFGFLLKMCLDKITSPNAYIKIWSWIRHRKTPPFHCIPTQWRMHTELLFTASSLIVIICWISTFPLFFSWGETESTWYCGHCLAYCTSPKW